jgi:hypothetical protein
MLDMPGVDAERPFEMNEFKTRWDNSHNAELAQAPLLKRDSPQLLARFATIAMLRIS